MRSLTVLFLLIFSFSLPGFATEISLFPVVLKQRYIENQSSDLYFQRVNSFAGSLTFDFYQLGIETGDWSTESGTSLISYKESYQEIHTTHLFKMGAVYDWLNFFSGFGIGSYESELTSQFNGAVSKTKSGQILMGSGIVSIQATVWHIRACTELKLLMAKDYRPQPTPELAFKLGAVF